MQGNLDKLVILLSSGFAQRRLYFADHPKVAGHSREFVAQLGRYLDEVDQDEIFLGVIDGKLVHNGRYLIGPSIAGGPLIEFVTRMHGGGLAFTRLTTDAEVRALFSMAAELREPTSGLTEARALLASRGITTIHVAAPYHEASGLMPEDAQVSWQGKDQGGGGLESPLLVYQALFDVVTAAHGNASLSRALDIESTRSVSEYLLHSTRANFTDIMHLMHYPDFDSYTVGHSVRVATLAVFAGDRLGLSDEHLLDLGTAGLLHDVGKSKIPDEILYKPGRLDAGEFAIMQSHAAIGAEILLEHKTATQLDVAAAWGHHIRHDGGGYPKTPPWGARNKITALLQICDVFEALTAVRPYKAPMTPRTAFEIMLKDQGAFDPGLLAVFVNTLGLYPPGNVVRLNDGTYGSVVAATADIERPRVRLTHDPEGKPLPDESRVECDLTSTPECSVAELVLEPDTVLA